MTAAVANTMDIYRRQARRLRCQYANQPARLQRSLKSLASQPTINESNSASYAGPAQTFAQYVERSITSPMLRYTERLELIETARRFGVSRFEANLLIAAVLERGKVRYEELKPEGGTWLGSLVTFLMIQGALSIGVWWMLFR